MTVRPVDNKLQTANILARSGLLNEIDADTVYKNITVMLRIFFHIFGSLDLVCSLNYCSTTVLLLSIVLYCAAICICSYCEDAFSENCRLIFKSEIEVCFSFKWFKNSSIVHW